jgi:O-antigen/teichoic acid export membrane protein
VTVCLTTLGAWLAGLAGAMWGSMIGTALTLLGLIVIYRRSLGRAGIPVYFHSTWQERRVLWTLAIPALLSGIMVAPVVWVTNAILVNSAGGYGEMGLFNAANQWRTILMYIPTIVLTPLLPIMTQLHATGQYQQLRRVLVRTVGLSVGAVGCLALGFSLFARQIMHLYGSGFEAGTDVFYLIMIVSILLSAGMVVGGLLSSTGAMWTGFLFNSVWAAAMIGTALVAVPRHGAFGLALAYAISYTIHTAIQFTYFWVYVRKRELPLTAPGYLSEPAEERLWG